MRWKVNRIIIVIHMLSKKNIGQEPHKACGIFAMDHLIHEPIEKIRSVNHFSLIVISLVRLYVVISFGNGEFESTAHFHLAFHRDGTKMAVDDGFHNGQTQAHLISISSQR